MSLTVAVVAVLVLIAGSMWLVYRNARRRPGRGDAGNAGELEDAGSGAESGGWHGDADGGGGGGDGGD